MWSCHSADRTEGCCQRKQNENDNTSVWVVFNTDWWYHFCGNGVQHNWWYHFGSTGQQTNGSTSVGVAFNSDDSTSVGVVFNRLTVRTSVEAAVTTDWGKYFCWSGVQYRMTVRTSVEAVFSTNWGKYFCGSGVECRMTVRTSVKAVFNTDWWKHFCGSGAQYRLTALPLVIEFNRIAHPPKQLVLYNHTKRV